MLAQAASDRQYLNAASLRARLLIDKKLDVKYGKTEKELVGERLLPRTV